MYDICILISLFNNWICHKFTKTLYVSHHKVLLIHKMTYWYMFFFASSLVSHEIIAATLPPEFDGCVCCLSFSKYSSPISVTITRPFVFLFHTLHLHVDVDIHGQAETDGKRIKSIESAGNDNL